MTKAISFIIPAFNAASTITRCLDSIYVLPIEESDFEVIVVDDCSTDNTVELVDGCLNNHSNIVLICLNENRRQGAARNRGVDVAKGKYIVFVDSDDESSRGVIKAVQLAEENGLDMVAMRFSKVGNDGRTEKDVCLPYVEDTVFTGVEMQTDFPFWNTGPCSYVYRKSFLDEINYPFAEDVFFEDSDFVNVHLYHAKRVSYCDECGNVVHFNADSTTHTLTYKHLSDYAFLGTRMLKFYDTIEDKSTKYAESILEGGSYNIWQAFRKLIRLKSVSEIQEFYNRFDAQYDRRLLLDYKKPAYCWTTWTRLGLKHKRLFTCLLRFALPVVKLVQK